MGATPNSLYEETLKTEAFKLLKDRPYLLFRNAFYRIAIMIAPVLYKHGTFIPKELMNLLYPIGFLLITIWLLGMYDLYKHYTCLFWLCLTIYTYFFSTIAFFYIVGRAIVPLIFINVLVYLFGFKFTIQIVREKFSPVFYY
jgi:hypothetical protein